MKNRTYAPFPGTYFETLLRGATSRDIAIFRNGFERLAPFLLRGETPRLKSETGTAHVLASIKGRMPDSPLRDAIILPFRWKRGVAAASPLPPRLAELSRRVAEDGDLRRLADGSKTLDGWTLWPDFPYDISDWEGLVETWDSAWGALAGGLTLARLGFRTRPDVMISASWKGNLQITQGETAKAGTAKEAGARVLYLSTIHDKNDLSRFEDGDFSIKRLPFNVSMRQTLVDLLYSLGVPPKASDGPEQYARCVEYARYFGRIANPEDANRYLIENITGRKAEEIRAEIGDLRTDSLAVLASQASAALLSIGVFLPREAVIFLSARDAEKKENGKMGLLDTVEKYLGNVVPENAGRIPKISHEVVDVATPGKIVAAISKWLEKPGRKVMDITGTNKTASTVAAILCSKRTHSDQTPVVTFGTDNPQAGGGYLAGAEKLIWIATGEGRNPN